MIPKIIHYCWFGGKPKPKSVEKCIDSWKKFCPDYRIIEWNEENFDINKNGYTRMCYEEKKYAFLSDYVRLLVIEEHGGVYFDTDVQVISSIDHLMENEAFFCFETLESVNTGEGFGSVTHGLCVVEMLAQYDNLLDGTQGVQMCPKLNTAALVGLGLKQDGTMQKITGAIVLPSEYMNPFDPATGIMKKTKNTVSIHWYSAAWQNPWKRLRAKIMRPLHRIFGVDAFRRFRK